MKKLYFNRCFTTTSQLVEQLRQNPNGDAYDVIISHSMPNHYLEEVSSHFEVESPNLKDMAYVGYILEMCSKYGIDLFLPRYNVDLLVPHADLLEKKGVSSMFVTTPKNYQLIENKVALYEDLKPTGIIAIPETYVISNAHEYETAYANIRSLGSDACMKPIRGIGGEGFKRIRDSIKTVDELFLSSMVTISHERVLESLNRIGWMEPFMLSEYMEEEEYSVDCLAYQGECLVAIPRRKKDQYRQVIEKREELMEIARQITKRYGLSYLFNIQVKYHKGIPYLVEINTRSSGGMYKTFATGANLIYEAIRLLEGKEPSTDFHDLTWNIEVHDSLLFGVRPIH